MERLKRLTRAMSLRRFKLIKSPDRSTGFENPLPSEACDVCATLREMFTDHIFSFRGSLETLETTCPGHGPLFDFLWVDLCKKLSQSDDTRDNDTTNNGGADAAQSRTGGSSGRTEEITESDKRNETPRNGRDRNFGFGPYELSLTSYPERGAKLNKIMATPTGTMELGYWTPVMARFYYEPQTPGFGRVLDPEWVDLELARQWKKDCFARHNDKCHNPFKINTVSPAWVIDTTQRCLVPGASVSEYVALSYRWGVSAGFRTTRHLLKTLQEPGALSQGARLGDSMAPILQHTIGLTQAIDERYLWVDAVCIVQDDEEHCATQLSLMGAIYATAKITIVATDGDAMSGILGLKGISPPRHIHQKIVPVFGTEKVIFRHAPSFKSSTSQYFDRGWTYQEFHLSQRRLIFMNGQIYWHCSYAEWEEDIIPLEDTARNQGVVFPRALEKLRQKPDFKALNKVLSEYNGRHLSFPEDALPGISGLLSILSRSFKGGFLFGLPEMAFDSALLWRSEYGWNMEKREDSGRKNLLALAPRLPSWSWVSQRGADFYVLDEGTSKRRKGKGSWTIPITQWFTHGTPEAIEKRRIHSHWFHSRKEIRDVTCEPPEGWTRKNFEGRDTSYQPSESLGQSLYQNGTLGHADFGVPVPVATVDKEVDFHGPAQTPYISCNTRSGRFDAAQLPISHFRQAEQSDECRLFHAGLLDGRGNYCGLLYLQEPDDILRFPEAESGLTCDVEIVAICRRRERKSTGNSWRIDGDEEELQDIDSRTELVFKDVYGVLWVEWTDGIAYRRASGIVDKDAWEGHDLEDVQLVMG